MISTGVGAGFAAIDSSITELIKIQMAMTDEKIIVLKFLVNELLLGPVWMTSIKYRITGITPNALMVMHLAANHNQLRLPPVNIINPGFIKIRILLQHDPNLLVPLLNKSSRI